MDNLLLAITSPPFFPGALTALGLIIQHHFTLQRGGRFGSECPADLLRNQWPISNGMGGRIRSESVADLERNLHMAARYLKRESSNLFINTELIFEKMVADIAGQMQVCEDQALYEVKSAGKSLE